MLNFCDSSEENPKPRYKKNDHGRKD